MPRLNNERYYQRHCWLRQLWLNHERRFSVLRPSEQWDIHAYYRPSEKLTKKELIKHRRKVSKEHPALPHRASKAYMILAGRAPAHAPTTIKTGRGRRITASSVVNPQIGKRLVRALIALAEQQALEEMERTSKQKE